MTSPLFLNLLVNTVVEQYFQNSRCMLIFSENSSHFEYKGNLPVVNLNIINTTLDEDIIFRGYGCQGILIQHTNPSAILMLMEEKIKLHRDRFNFRKYLIIPFQNEMENLSGIFNSSVLQYIVNMLVVIPVDGPKTNTECETKFRISCKYNETFKLMTHKYVGRNDNNAPKVLDLWFSHNKSFLNGNYLYPDKITDQQGRILRCATFNYKPYSIIEESPLVARGSENCVAHEYAKRHNMTVQYITDDDEWGIIYDNWTGNGILGNLATDKADIGYGALYTWEHEYSFLDFSKPVVRTGITCLVPAPRLAAGWLTPFFPFSLEMWIGTAVSFIVTWFSAIGLTAVISKTELQKRTHKGRRKKNGKPIDLQKNSDNLFLSMVRIFVIQSLPSTNRALKHVLKYMFVVFLFSVLLTSSYSSGLATVMTIPRYEGAINTVLDLANSGLYWGATQNAWIFSILAEERPQYVTLVNRFIPTNEENLMELAKTNHFAFSIERLPSGQYAIGSYVTEKVVRKLRLMHEDLYSEYCLIMLRKSSPLLNSIDIFVAYVFEAGLTKFWEMKAAQIHMDFRVQNIVKFYTSVNKKQDEGEESTVKLKWIHVEGAFGILITGYVLASLCFIKEIVVYKRKHRRPKFIN